MRKGGWLAQSSGKRFYPLDPRPEDVDIKDIALGLSRICRFNGQTKKTYTVADHCINVQQYLCLCGASTKTQLDGLLHDAAECYTCDIPKPLKIHLIGYAEIEKAVQSVIYKALNLTEPLPLEKDLIKYADNYLLAVEANQFMIVTDDWDLVEIPPGEVAYKYKKADKYYTHLLTELIKKYRKEEALLEANS
jgi:5'-deoxynucleotidase YfbR-like HD superfamily hydrolase